MLLGAAARFDRAVRGAYNKSLFEEGNESYRECRLVVNRMFDQMPLHFEDLLEICYPKISKHPEIFVTPEWIRDNVCEELDIPQETWNQRTGGIPLSILLASESPEMGGEGWTVKQAFMALHNLKQSSVLQVAQKMSRPEAPMFWARALGEKPPIPIDKLLSIISEGRKNNMTLPHIRTLLMTESPFSLLSKVVQEDDIPYSPMGIQPGQPFKGPVYHIWSKSVLPEQTYVDPIMGQRRYLHVTKSLTQDYLKGMLYNREGQRIAPMHHTDIPVTEGEHVFEVEMDGTRLLSITDYLSNHDDWYLYERPYVERLKALPQVKCEVRVPVVVESGGDIDVLLNKADGSVRLVSAGPFVPGGDGGWLLSTSSYEYNLLLSRVRKDENFDYHVRLSVLDGFDIREVGETVVPTGVVNHLRNRLARAGFLVSHEWMPVESESIVISVEVLSVQPDLTIDSCNILNLDDNLGLSDTSQITDLAEILA